MKKTKIFLVIVGLMVLLISGCAKESTAKETNNQNDQTEVQSNDEVTTTPDSTATPKATTTSDTASTDGEKVEILVAAAASLQYSMEELKTMYEAANPNVAITFTFGSSGALQQQIEQGAPVDVFMSAALKQMNELKDGGLVDEDTIKDLLENKVVLIVPQDSTLDVTSFDTILNAPLIALGDPESVPVGQYAEEIFTNLGILDKVKEQVSYGKDVTEVLTWVSTGNADAGVVYATDAATTDKIKVVTEAPEGSCSKVIYPVGIINTTTKEEAAKSFVDYLTTDEAMSVFEKYGFTKNQ